MFQRPIGPPGGCAGVVGGGGGGRHLACRWQERAATYISKSASGSILRKALAPCCMWSRFSMSASAGALETIKPTLALGKISLRSSRRCAKCSTLAASLTSSCAFICIPCILEWLKMWPDTPEGEQIVLNAWYYDRASESGSCITHRQSLRLRSYSRPASERAQTYSITRERFTFRL